MQGNTNLELMGDDEFEVLFNSLDRNNEIEFRMLFTPFSRQNMITLLKDKIFGDDFSFNKKQCINKIIPSKGFYVNINKEDYFDYSYHLMKEKYISVNEEYFYNFYKIFLPILSIALYQEFKDDSYIYEDDLMFKYNPYMQERLANLNPYIFEHKDAVMKGILKTKTIQKYDDYEDIEVISSSFYIKKHIDNVSVRAGDGRYYDVKVEWDEYLPINKTTNLTLYNLEYDKFKNIKDKLDSDTYYYDEDINILSFVSTQNNKKIF